MDMGLLRGVLTALLLFAFCGMAIWAYSSRRKDDFDAAAKMPLENESQVAAKESGDEQ